MNGRIYDPLLGRFLSADIVVQAPGNLQAYNRYSYVFNNPLSYTDPSGFETEAEKQQRVAEEKRRQEAEAAARRALINEGGILHMVSHMDQVYAVGDAAAAQTTSSADRAQSSPTPAQDRAENQSPITQERQGEVDTRATNTGGNEGNTVKENPKTDKPKPKGILFVRLNYKESEKETDQNSVSWRDLVLGLKSDLVRKGDIQGHQLNFALARTKAEALSHFKKAMGYDWEVVLSSHGHPAHDDYKTMFGRNVYKRTEFFDEMNQALGRDFLTVETKWYSCDRTNGTRTPSQIFEEEAKDDIVWRLKQINSE